MLSSSSSGHAGAASSLQYPIADLKQQAQKARTPAGTTEAQQQQQQRREQQELLESGIDNSSQTGNSNSSGSSVEELLKPLGPCPICSTSEILVPFVAQPCRHVFCYYCLQSHCAADSEFQCPVDGVRVGALQRYVRTVPAALN